MNKLLTYIVTGTLMTMSSLVSAETVLVTGSNRGIGFEFVKQYAKRGCTVIATARNPEKAKALKALATQHHN